jgi:hypothetical protein
VIQFTFHIRYAMNPENLIQEYLSALEKSDINKIFRLFKEDAIVVKNYYRIIIAHLGLVIAFALL